MSKQTKNEKPPEDPTAKDSVTDDTEVTPPQSESGNSGVDRDSVARAARIRAENDTRASIARDLGMDIEEAQTALTEYKRLKREGLSEAEALRDEINDLRAENSDLKAQLASERTARNRMLAGAEVGLDPDLWERIQGDDLESMIADAKKLAEKFTPQETTPQEPKPKPPPTDSSKSSGSGTNLPNRQPNELTEQEQNSFKKRYRIGR